jgi:hypothetical protein
MQSSPVSRHFLPQHPVLKHPQSKFHTHTEQHVKLYFCAF